jgi:phospholipase C
VIAHLQKGPRWAHMLVVVTYDDNGGFWDRAGPPKGNRWSPGSRSPTLIMSSYARRGFADHTLYDTTSILRFITKRYASQHWQAWRPATRHSQLTAARRSAI